MYWHDPTGAINNPGFSDEVWEMIASAWDATPEGMNGFFSFQDSRLNGFTLWTFNDGETGGGGRIVASSGSLPRGRVWNKWAGKEVAHNTFKGEWLSMSTLEGLTFSILHPEAPSAIGINFLIIINLAKSLSLNT